MCFVLYLFWVLCWVFGCFCVYFVGVFGFILYYGLISFPHYFVSYADIITDFVLMYSRYRSTDNKLVLSNRTLYFYTHAIIVRVLEDKDVKEMHDEESHSHPLDSPTVRQERERPFQFIT